MERPSPTRTDGFALTGPSNLPDPAVYAYRPDLADCALAHTVIASHYAEPLERALIATAILRLQPSDDAEAVAELKAGDPFSMLDNSLGWAWGYGGAERRVGYVRATDVGLPR
ncbi:MAG: SH3 domain-containing protein [Sphingomicrobium sp.]